VFLGHVHQYFGGWIKHFEGYIFSEEETGKICPLLGYYAAPNGSPLPTFRDNLSFPPLKDLLTLEDATDRLFQNIDKGLPIDAALYPRRKQISPTSRQKPDMKTEASFSAKILARVYKITTWCHVQKTVVLIFTALLASNLYFLVLLLS
jgi:hypothetical protein